MLRCTDPEHLSGNEVHAANGVLVAFGFALLLEAGNASLTIIAVSFLLDTSLFLPHSFHFPILSGDGEKKIGEKFRDWD
jgi:hypothetical protein